MRILVVEDETMVARQLCRLIKQVLDVRLTSIEHVYGLSEARSYLESNTIDVLFLDLNLSGDDGFDLLSEMVTAPFQTIVASANIDQALRSYEYGVADFVAKPFKLERIAKALAKVESVSETNEAGAGTTKYLGLRYLGKTLLVQTETIVYIQAAGRYSELFLSDDKSRLHEKKLKSLLLILPPAFHRIHKSYIANLDFASNIEAQPGSKYILQCGESQIPIGRTYLERLRARLN